MRAWTEAGADKPEPDSYGSPHRPRPMDDDVPVVQKSHEDFGR